MASASPSVPSPSRPKRVLLFGATGTIGKATARALLQRGHNVICVVRPHSVSARPSQLEGVELRAAHVTDKASLMRDAFRGQPVDAIVSCLASRTGAPRDAWAIDHDAHLNILSAACEAGAQQFVLVSALCVQKPMLAFQHAKLAFEQALMASGLTYSIVRPTAFFKSLSGQVGRVRAGKPFLLFGNGELTSCKPISDDDLAAYVESCLDDARCHNRVLPIGGPGAAITPLMQGEHLFKLLGKKPRFRHVPIRLLDAIIGGLDAAGRLFPHLSDKAELARIGRYYATESMLVLDSATGRYDADATPSTGRETLFDYYARLVAGEVVLDRGDHAVF